MFYMFIK